MGCIFLFYRKHSNRNEQIIIVKVIILICHVYYNKMLITLKIESNHKIKICYQHETLYEFAT